LRRGRDVELKKVSRSIPITADESVQGHADLAEADGCFDAIDIQLDKCGGLTAALDLARRAKALGLGVTIGNMLGSSLAAAPAFIVGQLCSMVELDSPTLLLEDRIDRAIYKNGMIWCPEAVWGHDSAQAAAAV
jgi:L-alanine-DL-glutamate epimerase-like enolase superfamily enzyme